MKKIALILIIISIFSIIFSGCNKEEINKNELFNSEVKPIATGGDPVMEMLVIIYGDEGQIADIYCTWIRQNCLPTVEIFSDASQNGNSSMGTVFLEYFEQGNISNFFANYNYHELFQGLDIEIVDQIISGDVLLHKIYAEAQHTYYFIGLDKELEFDTTLNLPEETSFNWYGQQSCVLRIKDMR